MTDRSLSERLRTEANARNETKDEYNRSHYDNSITADMLEAADALDAKDAEISNIGNCCLEQRLLAEKAEALLAQREKTLERYVGCVLSPDECKQLLSAVLSAIRAQKASDV